MIFFKKIFFFSFLIFSFHSFSQVTVKIDELRVGNQEVDKINFNNRAEIFVRLNVRLETTNNSFDNVFGNLYIYIKDSETTDPFYIGYASPVFDAFPNSDGKYISPENEIEFWLDIRYFESTEGRVLYAEYENNNGNKYRTSDIEIIDIYEPPQPQRKPFDISEVYYPDTGDRVKSDKVFMNRNHNGVNFGVQYTIKSSPRTICGNKFRYLIMKTDNFHINRKEDNYASIPESPCPLVIDSVTGDLPSIWISENEFKNNYGIKFLYFVGTSTRVSGSKGLRFKAVDFGDTDIYFMYSNENSLYPKGITGPRTRVTYMSDDLSESIFGYANMYLWYKRSLGGQWVVTTAPTESVLIALTETTEFFRRTVFKGAFQDSNVLRVEPRNIGNINNVICCSQALPNGSNVATLTGNYLFGSYTYAWQIYGRGSWGDIAGATSKNYTPPAIPVRTRVGEYPKRYRRMVHNNVTNETSYSNEIVISVASGRLAMKNIDLSEEENTVTLFPNPSTSILYAESKNDFLNKEIIIFDMTGRIVSGFNINYVNNNTLQIDISSLQSGVYMLKLQDEHGEVKKQFIKK
ncbi:T9SS type A sorting domain-containing protein [Flavobacterium sp. ST-75]|uniref:T9SS type A sorting domain-containing protein n=1 Tax=Flavobacterium rhizophilum TaxID=3163296 RepID=A0ABW8YDZ3_9FLAO